MPQNVVNQYNRAASGYLGIPASISGSVNCLLVKINSGQTKTLTGFSASLYHPPIGAATNPFPKLKARVQLVTGDLIPDDNGNFGTPLLLSQLNTPPYLEGTSKLLLDKTVTEDIYCDFSAPISIPDVETVCLIMGVPLVEGEVISTSGTWGSITLFGYDGQNHNTQFPYRLR